MTDIIARAKEIAEHPIMRNEWGQSVNFEDDTFEVFTKHPNLNTRLLLADVYTLNVANTLVELPNLSHAIAEETYEYTAQVHMYTRSWVFMWSPTSSNSVYGKWHATRKLAEKFADQWQLDYPTRLVRRRVSPVEVIE